MLESSQEWMCQEIHPEVRLCKKPPRPTLHSLQASVSMVSVKVDDNAITKKSEQVWLVFKYCQEKTLPSKTSGCRVLVCIAASEQTQRPLEKMRPR